MSVVEYIYDPGGPRPSNCGYCKSHDTNVTEGVWAHRMTCEDFQDLVDRGFQRSGKYVYRPVNDRVCCPQYIIRMDAMKFRPNKSQRKVVKRLHRYLREGKGSSGAVDAESDMSTDVSPKKSRLSSPDSEEQGTKDIRREKRLLKMAKVKDSDAKSAPPSVMDVGTPVDKPVGTPVDGPEEEEEEGEGANGEQPQDLLDLVTLPDPKDCVQQVGDQTAQELATHGGNLCHLRQLLRRVQEVPIHSALGRPQLRREATTPISSWNPHSYASLGPRKPGTGDPMPCDYGSYHQQYWLDGNLVAVALLDILPRMVVCEYFFYDPSYRFLSLGVYSAIREIAFVRELGQYDPRMRHYCMGYYVHSCPKMAYKNQYGSAELLCPVTLRYMPSRSASRSWR
eukprot:Em0016g318a